MLLTPCSAPGQIRTILWSSCVSSFSTLASTIPDRQGVCRCRTEPRRHMGCSSTLPRSVLGRTKGTVCTVLLPYALVKEHPRTHARIPWDRLGLPLVPSGSVLRPSGSSASDVPTPPSPLPTLGKCPERKQGGARGEAKVARGFPYPL